MASIGSMRIEGVAYKRDYGGEAAESSRRAIVLTTGSDGYPSALIKLLITFPRLYADYLAAMDDWKVRHFTQGLWIGCPKPDGSFIDTDLLRKNAVAGEEGFAEMVRQYLGQQLDGLRWKDVIAEMARNAPMHGLKCEDLAARLCSVWPDHFFPRPSIDPEGYWDHDESYITVEVHEPQEYDCSSTLVRIIPNLDKCDYSVSMEEWCSAAKQAIDSMDSDTARVESYDLSPDGAISYRPQRIVAAYFAKKIGIRIQADR